MRVEGVVGEGNEGGEHGMFRGKWDVVYEVLESLKIFISLLLKKNIVGGCLLCYLFFCLLFSSSIISQHPALCYFHSDWVYY